MYTLVFDIETIPTDEGNLTEEELEYLYRRAEDEEKERRIREMMALWAPTAHIVSVGLLIYEKNFAKILYLSQENSQEEEDMEGYRVKLTSYSIKEGIESAERKLLSDFWNVVGHQSIGTLVSFNGRSFDSPFLMLRSLLLDVKVSRNLIGNRYRYDDHIDLMDLLSFHGIGRPYSLDFLCRRLGFSSPKDFMKGDEVKDRFRNGAYRDIAIYNFYDVVAIGKLYGRLKRTMGEAFGLEA